MMRKTMTTGLILAVFAAAMPVYCGTGRISAKDLNDMLGNKTATVVDVRGWHDFQQAHIIGAVNAPYNSIDKAGLPKDGALVLYCGNDSCPLSHLAAKTLDGLGYAKVAVLEGGISAWLAAGFPVETSAGVVQSKVSIAIPSYPQAKLRKRLADKSIGIIDVRPAAEFAMAHMPGALNIQPENLEAASASLAKDKEWVLYGRQSGAARPAAQLLAAKGFKAAELSGGMQVWAAKKYPLETGVK